MFYSDSGTARSETTFELEIAIEDIDDTLSRLLQDGEPTSFRGEQFARQLQAERRIISAELARRRDLPGWRFIVGRCNLIPDKL